MTFTLPAQPVVLPTADTVSHTDNHTQLIAAALLGIATIIVLIVWRKMHPFLADAGLGGPGRRRWHPAGRHLHRLHQGNGLHDR